MIGAAALPPLNDNDGAEEAEAQRVFVRVITARPGPPWDQSRQAALEAKLGAPARLTDIVWRVRRLDSWRPGGPARFAAVYARAEDARKGLVATPTVEGRQVSVSFIPPAQQARRLRMLAAVALASGALSALGFGLVSTVIARRGETASLLDSAERVSASRLRQAESLGRLKRQTAVLDGEGLRGRRIADVLADVAWASAGKSPAAHIQALHWDHGFMAVEVEGADPPFAAPGRPVQKSKAPVRPGVWLWGVTSMDPWQAEGGRGRRAPAGPEGAP